MSSEKNNLCMMRYLSVILSVRLGTHTEYVLQRRFPMNRMALSWDACLSCPWRDFLPIGWCMGGVFILVCVCSMGAGLRKHWYFETSL